MEKILTLQNINPSIATLEIPPDYGFSQVYGISQPGYRYDYDPEYKKTAGSDKFDRETRSTFHSTSRSPITLVRQVVALCAYPDLFKSDAIPEDAKTRAESFLSNLPARAIGSYSLNPGIQIARKHVAEFISKRDGNPCNVNDIVTMTGSSEGVNSFIELIASGRPENVKTGILAPIPLDPKYKAIMNLHDIKVIPYNLDEGTNWSVSEVELVRALSDIPENICPKMIFVVSPNIPTGHVLSTTEIEDIIKFANEHKLLILVDESFQCDVYSDDTTFVSFKKVVAEMEDKFKLQELISINSVSNGYIREKGFRGGYAEVLNLKEDIWTCIYELLSAQHVPVTAQVVLDVMTNPPDPEEPSHELFQKEKEHVLSKLKSDATFISDVLKSMKNIECPRIKATPSLFPKVLFPEKALVFADKMDARPDAFYCTELSKTCGIKAVPGSAYDITGKSYHVCLSFDVDDVQEEFTKFKEFHENFIQRFC